MNDIRQKIMQQIQSGEIHMIPRWHFLLRIGLLVTGCIGAGLVTIYLLSFVFFALHATGLVFAPLFGPRGIVLFIVSSPWILIIVTGIFFGILYILVTRFSFSYRQPLVYTILGVVCGVIAVASLLQYVAFHERIGSFAEQHHVPGVSPLYDSYTKTPPPGIIRGVVVRQVDDTLFIERDSGDIVTVYVNEMARHQRDGMYTVGEELIVFGDVRDGVMTAFGIRYDDGGLPPPPPSGPMMHPDIHK